MELWKNLPVILDADFTNLINSFVVDNAFIGEDDETCTHLFEFLKYIICVLLYRETSINFIVSF